MGIVLLIPSDWTTVINAVIFEVVLITLIFFLTADVCARLNYLALLDGSVRDLVVMSPPLVGGGVISTNRQRSLLMIMLRSLGILLIFGTALTIDGESTDVRLTKTKMVRSPGDLSNLNRSREAATEVVNKLMNLRYTCTVSSNNSMVFGRLDVNGDCETDISLLQNATSISSDLESTSASFSRSCRHRNVTFFEKKVDSVVQFSMEYVITTCEQDDRKAVVFCFRKKSKGVVQFVECVASLQLNATKFAVCESFNQVLEGSSVAIDTDCHPAANLGVVQNLWPRAMAITRSTSIVDMIAAVSVAGEQTRKIEEYARRDVTKVHHMWFLCLAVKLILLALLGVLSIHLQCKGAKRVLNDDRALLGLLKQRLDDWIGVSNTQEQPTIYLHLQTNQEGERNVWASPMPNYNVAVNNPEAEA